MTAKVYFPAWCEPPQIIHMAVSYNKSCFGKIVFQCDIHHCFFRKPSVQNTDSCLVPPKYPVVVGLEELTGEPFILLEEGYAIMTMVEAVLGISILAELVLRRTNYNIVYILDFFQSFCITSRNDFVDIFKTMYFITRIDTFR